VNKIIFISAGNRRTVAAGSVGPLVRTWEAEAYLNHILAAYIEVAGPGSRAAPEGALGTFGSTLGYWSHSIRYASGGY
jgi:hypothetical protein